MKLSKSHRNKISLSMMNHKVSASTRRKISKGHKGKTYPNLSFAQKGKKKSKEHCKNIGLARLGKSYEEIYGNSKAKKLRKKAKLRMIGNTYTKNVKKSAETIRKHRVAAINNIEKYRGKLKCFVGKNEKRLLDEQEIKNNCEIIRQHKIRELGYIVDGYDKANNVVYEVYEKYYHIRKPKKDLKRQREIQKFLKCKFKIIWDNR